MKIHTRTVWDMNTGEVLEDEAFEWSGAVAECKGQDVAKQQMDQQNQITRDQLNQQKAIRDQIMQSTSQYTTGAGQGYDPAQFSAMISQFLNQNSANFNQAGSQVMSSLNARGAGGGNMPVGGDFTRGLEALQGARASSQSQGILGANISNLQQALNNKFNALGLQSGQGAQLGQNIGVFNQGANSALGDYIKGINAPGFMSGVGQVFGQAVGAGLGGGIANAIGKIPGFGKPS
jgi:hypothetical protein